MGISSLVLCIVIMLTSVVSVSAVEQISTGDYYMGGYRLYGTLTVYSTYASGFTFCEKEYAHKTAYTCYAYYDTNGVIRTKSAGTLSYETQHQYDVAYTTTPAGSGFDYYAGAKNVSKVKFPNQSYYEWMSDETDNALRMGYYINHN